MADTFQDIWTDSVSHMRFLPFKGSCQLNFETHGETPKDFVDIFINDDFLDLLITKTNESLNSLDRDKNCDSQYRQPVDRSEMRIFIAFIVFSGIVKLPQIDAYWRNDSLFKIQALTEKMKKLRFLSILKNFCLVNRKDNKKSEEIANNLYQVEPLVSHFNSKMKVLSPNKEILITEPIILMKDSFKSRNELPNSSYKNCLKLFYLADCSKFIMKIFIANGIDDLEGNEILKIGIAMKLLEEHLDKGHSVYMDRYYSSLALSTILLDKSTYSTGLISPSRKMFPKALESFKLSEGQLTAKFSNDICISKMMIGCEKYFISSEYNDEKVKVETKKGIKQLPKLLCRIQQGIVANSTLLKDTAKLYPFEKYMLRWHRKVAFHIIHIIILNSYYLFEKFSGKNMNMYDFRLHVIKSLIVSGSKLHPSNTIVANLHVPKKSQFKEKCKLCLMKNVDRSSSFHCLDCQETPYLCLEPCFRLYHGEH